MSYNFILDHADFFNSLGIIVLAFTCYMLQKQINFLKRKLFDED